MINRILIRIKVVQMLYSYLLTRSEFHLLEPDNSSRDSKYAYSVYINLLLIVLQLSGFRVSRSKSSPMEALGDANMLAGSKLAKALAADSAVREIIGRGDSGVEIFNPALMRLYSIITSSAIYIDYRKKKRPSLDDEVRFWTLVLNTVIAPSQLMAECARTDSNFSIAGFQKGVAMAVETLRQYADSERSYADAKSSLAASLDKAYELYHALLMLPVYLTQMEAERIEAAKEKYIPTDEELNPNMRFVDNAFIRAVRENPDMEEYLKKHPFSWESDFLLLKDLLVQIKESKAYADYMEAEETTFADDCELWRVLMKNIVLPSDVLAEALEGRSIYWNDDLSTMGTFVLKTIRHIAQSGPEKPARLLPIYKDQEDADFGPELFYNAIKNRDTYRGYVEMFIDGSNWDPERLAFMDIVILITAITELIRFPQIPLAVTMNEYVEIANYYSTRRSGQFVNGVLFSVANMLREEGKISKF